MASGVFGHPISEETVIATGEYREPITQKDVANYAMKMINAGGKDIEAQKFVDSLKDSYGIGTSTKCLIYNATGTTLSFVTYKDWYGYIYNVPYPSEIQNGQWGAYLHVHSVAAGCTAAAVYRSKIPSASSSCDWLFSWSIPLVGSNTVYTEIGEEDHFLKHWTYIYQTLGNSGRSCTDDNYGYRSRTDIGEGYTVNARAIFMLPD